MYSRSNNGFIFMPIFIGVILIGMVISGNVWHTPEKDYGIEQRVEIVDGAGGVKYHLITTAEGIVINDYGTFKQIQAHKKYRYNQAKGMIDSLDLLNKPAK